MSEDDHPVMTALRRLPVARPDDLTSERVKQQAKRAFLRERHPAVKMWRRVLVPVLVAATATTYLAFAISAAARLY